MRPGSTLNKMRQRKRKSAFPPSHPADQRRSSSINPPVRKVSGTGHINKGLVHDVELGSKSSLVQMIGQTGSLPHIPRTKDPNYNEKGIKVNTPEASARAMANWGILRRNMHVISGANTKIDFTHLGECYPPCSPCSHAPCSPAPSSLTGEYL